MLKYWRTLDERYRKLKLRERALIALAAIAMAYLVADTVLIAPEKARQRVLAQETAQKRQQVQAFDARLRAARLERSQDPEIANRRRLEALRAQLAAQQAAIKEQSERLVPAERMPALLERLLANHPRLELVDIKALPQERLDVGSGAKPAARPAEPAPSPDKAAAEKGAQSKGRPRRPPPPSTSTGWRSRSGGTTWTSSAMCAKSRRCRSGSTGSGSSCR
jgi:hypothetical protein